MGGVGSGRPIPPEMLAGMLRAARQSLMEGRYQEAIAAYQAVLKRDTRNVDAMTHLGLIVAIGGHADTALETLERALAIDPAYPPAYLYRGQILYEVKRDYPGAVAAWQRFLALVPTGEEHDRVKALVQQAAGPPARELTAALGHPGMPRPGPRSRQRPALLLAGGLDIIPELGHLTGRHVGPTHPGVAIQPRPSGECP